ncbi:MAG: C40 family peptidase, partial [Bacteroidota bacterium]|nr:C40 family peptidase [Bacteroidota bacterium]
VLCNVSVAPVMKYNSHQSEQVTQVLLGESADVLEQRAGWVRIRLRHDDYLGWASANQLHVIDEKELAEWQSKIKIGSHDLIMPLLESPRKNSGAIGEFLFGTFLPVKTVTKAWTSVIMPDGKIGWVQSSAVTQPNEKKTVTTGHLAETAKRFLGISYQWGGRSVKGFDCSGFTQTVYRLNGVDIPRDASLQSLTGKEIGGPKRKSAPKALMNFVEGDLLFFSANNAAESFPPKRITHVAMSLSGTEFIHASGSVKVNSFDESQPHFNELLLRDFVGACRIIG